MRRTKPTPQRPHVEPIPDDPDDRTARLRQLRVVAEELERCRRFQEWGDPLLGAWAAYETARSNGVDVPEWVDAYLRRVAMNLHTVSRQAPSGRALSSMVLQALGITHRLSRRETARRDVVLADAVADRVAAGEDIGVAQRAVASERAVEPQVVERAWRASGRAVKKSADSLK
jgi:hypothetical protein